jgi:hypothetical protein
MPNYCWSKLAQLGLSKLLIVKVGSNFFDDGQALKCIGSSLVMILIKIKLFHLQFQLVQPKISWFINFFSWFIIFMLVHVQFSSIELKNS